jgi:CHAD domain-containing protein
VPPRVKQRKRRRFDAAPRLSRVVAREAKGYHRAVAAGRVKPSRAAVHRLRVATRRVLALRELALLVGAATPDDSLERYLRAPFRPCGQLRDLQVAIRRVETLLRRYPEAGPFLRALERDERKARRRAARALAAAHPQRVARILAALGLKLDAAMGEPAGRARAASRIARLIGEASGLPSSVGVRAVATDPDLIHRVRLSLKARRYVLELAAALGLPTRAAQTAKLRLLQATMGEITDRTLLLRLMTDYQDGHPRAGARLERLHAAIERRQRRLIGQYFRSVSRIRD